MSDTKREERLKTLFKTQKKEKKTELKKVKNQQKPPSCFDNPVAKEKYDSLTQEQKDYYKAAGENIYSYDYSQMGNPEIDALTYLIECVKAGLHISDLQEHEVQLFIKYKGAEWYKEYQEYCSPV
jgi:hypothetical protein